jgi:hypothetical protein
MRLIRVLGHSSLVIAVPIPAGAQPATPAAVSPRGASGDVARLVDIGSGRDMYLTCSGAGSPTIILEAGVGIVADIWDTVALPPGSLLTAVLPGVAAVTRVSAYDRPGTLLDFDQRSHSDPVPMPRTAADAVADLHALLTAAGVSGPQCPHYTAPGGIQVRGRSRLESAALGAERSRYRETDTPSPRRWT